MSEQDGKLAMARDVATDIDELARFLFRVQDGLWTYIQLRDSNFKDDEETRKQAESMLTTGVHLLGRGLLVLKYCSYKMASTLDSDFKVTRDEMTDEEWDVLIDKVEKNLEYIANTFGSTESMQEHYDRNRLDLFLDKLGELNGVEDLES